MFKLKDYQDKALTELITFLHRTRIVGVEAAWREALVKRYRPKKNLEAFDLVNGAASVAHAMGFEVLASVLQRSNAENQGVVLDGLLVLWHPSSQ